MRRSWLFCCIPRCQRERRRSQSRRTRQHRPGPFRCTHRGRSGRRQRFPAAASTRKNRAGGCQRAAGERMLPGTGAAGTSVAGQSRNRLSQPHAQVPGSRRILPHRRRETESGASLGFSFPAGTGRPIPDAAAGIWNNGPCLPAPAILRPPSASGDGRSGCWRFPELRKRQRS